MRLAAQKTHHQQTNQTNLKLPNNHQRIIPTRDKMKLNWRANWETLLVFVIIIVGIVITTIAAIRSKDKHLLVAPDESADYGSGGVGSGIVDLSSSLQVPPLPQTDFQMQNGLAATAAGDGGLEAGGQEGATDEPVTSTRRPPRSSSTSAPHQTVYRGDRKRSHSSTHSSDGSNNSQHPTADMGSRRPPSAANIAAEAIVGSSPMKTAHSNSRGSSSSSSSPSVGQSHYMTSAAGLGRPSIQVSQPDSYEPLSTEQTPSQLLRSPPPSSSASLSNDNDRPFDSAGTTPTGHQQQQPDSRHHQSPTGDRRNAAESKQQRNLKEQLDSASQLGDFGDQLEAQLDGGGSSNTHKPADHHNSNNNYNQQLMTMQGPYELTSLQAHQQQQKQQQQQQAGPANRNSHMKLAQLPEGHTIRIEQVPSASSSQSPPLPQPPPPPTLFDSEDMMTSYTRVPKNLTGAHLRGDSSNNNNINPGSMVGSSGLFHNKSANSMLVSGLDEETSGEGSPSTPDYNSQLASGSPAPPGPMPALMSPPHHHRAYATSLPFAMLLNDLIKVSRPHQPLIDAQAGLEQPANSRPQQYGILQQLRSLPGPLLALFQQAGTAGHLSGGTGDLQTHHLANHDTSESNDHYHRISMTPYSDLNSLVARSLRTTNPLPAFPAPKGVPQTWVPSNMGGVSMLQEAASNADFVASETSGFIRGTTLAGGGGLQMAASNVNQQEQVASEINTNQNYQAPNNDATRSEQSQQQQQHSTRQPQAGDLGVVQQQQQQPPTNQNQNLNNHMNAQPAPVFGASTQQPASGRPSVYMPAQATSELAQPNVHVPSSSSSPSSSSQMNYNNLPGQQQQQRLQYINQNSLQQSRPLQRSDGVGGLPRLGTSVSVNGGNTLISAAKQQQNFGGQIMTVSAAGVQSGASSVGLPNQSSGGGNKQMAQLKQLPDRTSQQRANQPIGGGVPQSQPIQLNTINRVRRSAVGNGGSSSATRHSEAIRKGAAYGDSESGDEEAEEEEYLDSSPVSIVRPDGRPMSGNVQIMRPQRVISTVRDDDNKPLVVMAQASSQRQVNHADLNDSALHHYVSHESPGDAEGSQTTRGHSSGGGGGREQRRSALGKRKQLASDLRLRSADEDGQLQEVGDVSDEPSAKRTIMAGARKTNKRNRDHHEQELNTRLAGGGGGRSGERSKNSLGRKEKIAKAAKRKKLLASSGLTAMQLDAASSGLMSKLLGVASTNDELEDDMDSDDDESANERRKEELEDAEFGIVNDDRSNGPSQASDGGSSSNDIGDGQNNSNDNNSNDVSRLTQHDVPQQLSHTANQEARPAELPMRPSGTTDNNAYARRNQQQQQQRSDVEFYGHPGEETRQLKYGILGSGNYEVVNGGIYPDIDESTAAVNSVANYVRKPGVLLADLPKLIGATGGAGTDEEGRPPGGGVPLIGGPPRLGEGGGFMRGASAANPGELVSFFSSGPSFNKITGGSNSLLMDVLDAAHAAGAGQAAGFFDPNLMAHLGSSGTSARTTHASRDQDSSSDGVTNEDKDDNNDEGNQLGNTSNDQLAKAKRKRGPKQQLNADTNQAYSPRQSVRYNDNQSLNDKSKAGIASNKNELMTTMETLNDANNRIRSSNANDAQQQQQPARKMNQFYSYHILPSKKVTIFSDQDLDSAPDEQTKHATYLRPPPPIRKSYLASQQ